MIGWPVMWIVIVVVVVGVSRQTLIDAQSEVNVMKLQRDAALEEGHVARASARREVKALQERIDAIKSARAELSSGSVFEDGNFLEFEGLRKSVNPLDWSPDYDFGPIIYRLKVHNPSGVPLMGPSVHLLKLLKPSRDPVVGFPSGPLQWGRGFEGEVVLQPQQAAYVRVLYSHQSTDSVEFRFRHKDPVKWQFPERDVHGWFMCLSVLADNIASPSEQWFRILWKGHLTLEEVTAEEVHAKGKLQG